MNQIQKQLSFLAKAQGWKAKEYILRNLPPPEKKNTEKVKYYSKVLNRNLVFNPDTNEVCVGNAIYDEKEIAYLKNSSPEMLNVIQFIKEKFMAEPNYRPKDIDMIEGIIFENIYWKCAVVYQEFKQEIDEEICQKMAKKWIEILRNTTNPADRAEKHKELFEKFKNYVKNQRN